MDTFKHEEPEEWEIVTDSKQPEKEVENLDSTEDGEASEKAHGATNQTQLGFHCYLQIV